MSVPSMEKDKWKELDKWKRRLLVGIEYCSWMKSIELIVMGGREKEFLTYYPWKLYIY